MMSESKDDHTLDLIIHDDKSVDYETENENQEKNANKISSLVITRIDNSDLHSYIWKDMQLGDRVALKHATYPFLSAEW